MLTPGAATVGASRSKSLGPRELNQATASPAAGSRTSSVVEPRRTVTGSWLVVTKLCSASPAAWVTLIAGIAVPCDAGQEHRRAGLPLEQDRRLGTGVRRVGDLDRGRQVPVGMSAIAPSNPPAGNAEQPVTDPTWAE